MVITTTDSKESANSIAQGVLAKKLGACVQIEEIKSHYLWRGEIESVNEFKITIKTKKTLYSELESEILAKHPYEVPQIVSVSIEDGLDSYFKWIDEEIK
jgi:periplasmic divalent cation tolerance protein